MSFKGKTVLVTGGSSNIGAATAIQFATEGARVAITGKNATKLANVEKLISKAGCKPVVIVADLTKDEDVRRIISETIKKLGSLDVLVTCAGVNNMSTIFDKNFLQTLDKMYAINFLSVAYLIYLAMPHLVQSKGNVVNISSIEGLTPVTGYVINSSVKAALLMFTRCTAADAGKKGVRANSVIHGPVATEKSDERQPISTNSNLLHRVSDPEEIADLVLYLASDKGRGTTGSLFVTDNGMFVKNV